MNTAQRRALISHLAAEMESRGSWVGEMHLQKAVYLAQTLTGFPTDFPFILYHYGPFSVELREELNRMRAGGLLELEAKPAPYGPSFKQTGAGADLENRFPKTLARFAPQLEFVTSVVGAKSAAHLERLATAAYLVHEEPKADPSLLAKRLHGLKPHVDVGEALVSVKEILSVIPDAPQVG
jgi:hypothetical protein